MERISVYLLGALAIPGIVLGQVYDDTQIRTFIKLSGVWDMTNPDDYSSNKVASVQGLGLDKFVGIGTVVYSDNAYEAFNLTRQSGINTAVVDGCARKHRSGGWTTALRYDPASAAGYTDALIFNLYSGSSSRLQGCNSTPGNFFSSPFPTMQISSVGRHFSGLTGSRAAMKLDYVCTSNCPANSVNTLWLKLGKWDMNGTPSLTKNIDAYGVSPGRVVGMQAAILSDPASVQYVDNLEHMGAWSGAPAQEYTTQRGRGGILWYGYGCKGPECGGLDPGLPRVRLYAGSKNGPNFGDGAKSSFRGALFLTSQGQKVVNYTSMTLANRGWLKIDYTGTPTSIAIPYAMKTVALPLGPWDMSSNGSDSIAMPYFSTDRVTSITTTIQSDNIGIGWYITNLHRPATESGTEQGQDTKSIAGGVTYIEGRKIRISLLGRPGDPNFFDVHHQKTSANRGWVKLDYLMGSCEQGPSGFKIQAVPGTQVGDCAGSASPFAFEGGGWDIWGRSDEFTYMRKTASVDKDLQVKIETQSAGSAWSKSGIMMRASLAANAQHASILMTPSVGAHFTWRAAANDTTVRTSTNALKAPYYLRLVKSGTTFTAYVRASTTASWTVIGSRTLSGFPSTYYYGIAQSGNASTLAKSTFSGLTNF